MNFPAGPILSTSAQLSREPITPRAMTGAAANGAREQVGLAGRHEHEYDHRNGTWVCWICDHTLNTRPPVEATELAE